MAVPKSRTAQAASSWVRPWMPAPKMATTRLSGRANRSTAAPLPAPVRMAVSELPSSRARVFPVEPSNSRTAAWMKANRGRIAGEK
jgi:hypothetical protein